MVGISASWETLGVGGDCIDTNSIDNAEGNEARRPGREKIGKRRWDGQVFA